MSILPSFSEERLASIAIKSTPSYIYNNLTYNGSHFAYVHKNEVYLVADPSVKASATPIVKANLKEGGQVYQAKWITGSKGFISEGGKNMLVVASSNNVQVLDADAAKLFFSFSIPNPPADATPRTKFSRGITTANASGSRSFLLVGTSSGSILAFESKRDKDLAFAQVIKAHGFPITELATDISNPNIWASGDHSGVLVVWNGLDKEISFPGNGLPCTSLALRSGLLIATFGNGVITIYNLKSKTKCVEIEAHSRCINAIDIHPFKDIFVTVSDDSSVNAWALNTDITEVTHIFNGKIKDSLLCGVQFSGENYSSIAVSAYDSPNLSVFTS
eukprot:TRINITY_DN7746_c0_g1_i1.p1 TRINITY_DN7746_c0_g1~~TRINITY_DN7746_c0_g1_i1.p1  ORF type:complete len:345 (+),score=75.54 TRINITY_DN7746_c0_g1_i1:40-1035(+)